MPSVADIRTQLFKLYPEFNTTDPTELARVDCFIQDAFLEVCQKTFGKFYTKGLVLLSAHFLSINGGASGTGSSSETAGPISSKKIGDLSVSYGGGGSSSGGGSFVGGGPNGQTSYGRQYDALCKRLFVSPLVT